MLLDTALCALLRAHGASQTLVDILRRHGYDAQLCGGHLITTYGTTVENIVPDFFADARSFYLIPPSSNHERIAAEWVNQNEIYWA